MSKNTQYHQFQPWLIFWLILSGIGIVFPENQTLAQITPDNTLGSESSIVTPVNPQLEKIDGGAIRSNNLFHSFTEFNIGEGKQAYFSNPAAIENIFSRVTGSNPSRIFGQLGVLGDANLFFLNPNGILFGENASLDIKGSFFASTASSINFANGENYSAINPSTPPLLSVNVKAPIGLQFEGGEGDIDNQGNLIVGKDLSLNANNLTSQGNIEAGKDLTLTAQDTVKVRDSVEKPFIAAAGGNLLIQGKESIDIFALNHSGSGLFSGGDMVLSSTNPVVGDIHFWSGGNFQIEKLDKSKGDLFSFYDPIIRSQGDISFDSYTGASLHIFAGGSVNILGDIEIRGTDTAENSIREQVKLSDGKTVIDIDGSSKPTLDIRAGTTAFGEDGIVGNTDGFFDIAIADRIRTNADINIGGAILVFDFTDGGQVFLTNQYKPNLSLNSPNGITVGFIDARDDFGGGSVTIDSRSNITLNQSILVSAFSQSDFGPFFGNAGNATLLANKNIIINPQANIISLGLLGGDIFLSSKDTISASNSFLLSLSFSDTIPLQQKAGNINLIAKNVSITNSSRLIAGTLGKANAGNINLKASESTYINEALLSSQVLGGSGNASNITVDTGSLIVDGGGQITSLVASNTTGNGGDVNVTAQSVEVVNDSSIAAQVNTTGRGNAGNINIEAGSLRIAGGGQISSGTFGEGNAGNLSIRADRVEVIGESANTSSTIFSSTEAKTNGGSGGNLTIETKRLLVADGGQISTATVNNNNAGNLKLTAQEIEVIGANNDGIPSRLITASEIASEDAEPQEGVGGNLTIKTGSLLVADGGQISSATLTKGDAGRLSIKAESVKVIGRTPNGVFPSSIGTNTGNVFVFASGDAGKLSIETDNLIIADGAQVISSTFGSGAVGELEVKAKLVEVTGSGMSPKGELPGRLIAQVESGATGNAGNLIIDTERLRLDGGGQVAVNTFGQGYAGNLQVTAKKVEVIGGVSNGIGSALRAEVDSKAIGNGGNLKINTESLKVSDGGQISADTFGEGKAGNIIVTSNSLEATKGGQIRTSTSSSKKAGNITLNIKDNITLTGSETGIFANTTENSTGNGGSIIIDPETVNIKDGARISVDSQGTGIGGNVNLTAGNLNLDNGTISAKTRSNTGGDITLNIQDLLLLRNNSQISTTAGDEQFGGDGGNINVNSPDGFIVAFPNENSDITANAFSGNGGNVDITAFGIFGIEFREKPTSLSDITATSQFGFDGNVNIETPGIEPNPETVELPEDAQSTEVAQGCQASGEAAVAFFNIGRGGLPSSPGETLNSEDVIASWIPLVMEGESQVDKNSRIATGTNKKIVITECRL